MDNMFSKGKWVWRQSVTAYMLRVEWETHSDPALMNTEDAPDFPMKEDESNGFQQ